MATDKKEAPVTKQISATELKSLINDKRFKYTDIAEYYQIPVAAAKRAVKEAGLTMRKFKTTPFAIVHDLPADGNIPAETTEALKNVPVKEEEKQDLTAREEETPVADVPQVEETTKVEEATETQAVEETVTENVEIPVVEEPKEEIAETATETTTTEEATTETVTEATEDTTTSTEETQTEEGFANKPAEEEDSW